MYQSFKGSQLLVAQYICEIHFCDRSRKGCVRFKASAVKIYTSAKLSRHNTCERSVYSVDLRLWFREQFLELLLSASQSKCDLKVFILSFGSNFPLFAYYCLHFVAN